MDVELWVGQEQIGVLCVKHVPSEGAWIRFKGTLYLVVKAHYTYSPAMDDHTVGLLLGEVPVKWLLGEPDSEGNTDE